MEFGTEAGAMSGPVVEFFTVVDMTPGKESARLYLGNWTGKVHSLTSQGAAKSRRTQLANKFPDRTFRVLKTHVFPAGNVHNWWLPE